MHARNNTKTQKQLNKPKLHRHTTRSAWVDIETDHLYESRERAFEAGVPEERLFEMCVPTAEYHEFFGGTPV